MIDEIKVWRTVRSQEEVGGLLPAGAGGGRAAPRRNWLQTVPRFLAHTAASPPRPLLQIQAGMRGNLYRKGLPGGPGAAEPSVDPHHPDLVAFW